VPRSKVHSTSLILPTVYEVFTPTSRAKLNFVPRPAVNDHLVAALRTPGKQVIVYGETGSGKSTLLEKKLEELYEAQITTRCHAISTFDQLLLSAFDQLDAFYKAEEAAGRDSRLSAGLTAELIGIRASHEASRSSQSEVTHRRLVPPQLTPQRLGELLGALRLCWVLEDFHKVSPNEKTMLSQTLKIFSDLSGEYPALKVIAIGATDTARQVVEYDAEMRHRVAEIFVPLMDEDELSGIIHGGQVLLNVNMTALRETFVRYSMGVASVCHQLALNACLNEGVMTRSDTGFLFAYSHVEPALKRWVTESSDSLKATFERALRRHKVRKFDNTRLILRALARGPLSGLLHGEILKLIRQEAREYPAGNLSLYLRQLMDEERGSLILSTPEGRFRFVDPLHHTFAQASLLTPEERQPKDKFTRLATRQLFKWLENDRPITGRFSIGPIFLDDVAPNDVDDSSPDS
jgi:energy-coupling factor transporter ATP-binding protein EcfA2